MLSEAPPFWWQPADARAWALWPVSATYGAVATRLMRKARREPVPAPVLCVGNLTVGGAGKTPVAIALAQAAKAEGRRPGILSRGHGGSFSGVHIVDVAHDSARHVGDEPLLLARHATVAVAIDRARAARSLIAEGCDFLIMDDGFQSARVLMDYALLVIDGSIGIGNGHLIPGGPLRAPVAEQLRYADGLLRVGEGKAAASVIRQAARSAKPLFEGRTIALDAERLTGRRLLAFSGIGHPEKFFRTVRQAAPSVLVEQPFPDHHLFTDEELLELEGRASREGLELVTTAKDAVRIGHGSAVEEAFGRKLIVLEIETVFEPAHAATAIIRATLEAWQRRGGD